MARLKPFPQGGGFGIRVGGDHPRVRPAQKLQHPLRRPQRVEVGAEIQEVPRGKP
jgi:hypothetical protein